MPHKRVLLIDDENELRESIADFLRVKGYIVFEANNGKHGLERIKIHKPDVVVCDILMPDVDGFEVLQKATSLPDCKNTSFVMLTALNDDLTKEKCKKLGAEHFLSKPFLMTDLLSVL